MITAYKLDQEICMTCHNARCTRMGTDWDKGACKGHRTEAQQKADIQRSKEQKRIRDIALRAYAHKWIMGRKF